VVRRVAFAVPGDLATPTGGYAYDRRMIAELRALGWQVDVIDLGANFPHPDAAQKRAARDRLAAVERDVPVVVDGLAFGVLPEAANELRARNPLLALVHHPLALETGLSDAEADALRQSERNAIAATCCVVVTSAATARLLISDYGVRPHRITVAPPGTDRVALAAGSGDGIVRLLSVGAIVPRKGFDVLVEALATLTDLPWRLAIAGDRTRDAAAAARLDADIARFNLQDRIEVLGAVDHSRLAALYAGADLFVLASRFEGYGMAYAEAIAHGLPVIGTSGGATADTVPPSASVLVPPDDVGALAAALRRLIANAGERKRFASAARTAAAHLPTWADSAKLFVDAIERATRVPR
jgi:glycosyltransferase involved in cell wall biosynthesis